MTLLVSGTQHVTDSLRRESLEYGCEAYNNFLAAHAHISGLLTSDEKKAVFEYTGWFYRDYQAFLKNPTTVAPSQIVQDGLGFMDSALAKSPRRYDNVLYHGVPKDLQNSMSFLRNPYFVAEHDTFVRKSFLSTSIDPKVASDTTGGHKNSLIFEIFSNDGLALNDELSEHGLREKEVLLPRGKKFRIVGLVNDVVFSWGATTRTHTVVQLEDLT